MVLEIHRVKACREAGGSWAWDSAQSCGTFRTSSYDVRRAIKRVLAGMGITFGKNRTRVTFEGGRYVIRIMTTGEPLYIAALVAAAPPAMKSSPGRNTP